MVNIENLLKNSVILTNWIYLVPVLLFSLGIIKFLESKNQPRLKPEKKIKKKLSEEEYIGDFDAGEENEEREFHPALEEKPPIPYPGATIMLPNSTPLEAANKFYEIMNNRRSCRMFSDKPIDFEIIKKCIHTAATSPSGAHTEPWTFCVVSDPKVKREIREIIEDEEYQNYVQRMSRRWVTDLKPLNTNFVKEYLTVAPYLVLVFKQTYGLMKNGKTKKQHYYNEISTSIATGILLSAFQCAGLSSLVTTPLNCGPAISRLLERPKNEKLLVLLPVGYPAEDCTIPDLQRKPIEEVLVRY